MNNDNSRKLYLVCAMLCLFSCLDDDNPAEPEEAQCRLIQWSTPESSQAVRSYSFTYNNDGNPEQALVVSTEVDFMTQQQTVETRTYQFEYANGLLSSVNVHDGNGTDSEPTAVYSIQTEGDLIKYVTLTQAENPDFTISDTIQYDADQRITRVSFGDIYTRYEYDAAGNTTAVYQKTPMSDEETESVRYTSFDDKINPLRSNSIIQWFWVYLNSDYGYSTNNATRAQSTITMQNGDAIDLVTTYAYTYNTENFPVSVTESTTVLDQTSQESITITYECN